MRLCGAEVVWIVMPAIYRFSFPDSPKESGWGWHRAGELVEAANTILKLAGKPGMSPAQISKLIDPHAYAGFFENGYKQPYSIVRLGKLHLRYSGGDWLGDLVTHDCYLPAKIGMEILAAVKHPIRSKVKKLLVG